MTKIHYYSGLDVIGGTVVEIETEQCRCLFDFGFAVCEFLDEKVKIKEQDLLERYLNLNMVPDVKGIFPDSYSQENKKVFFLLSHAHIDHCQGFGLLADEIPIYMSENTKKMCEALYDASDFFYRKHENLVAMKADKPVTIGDITVEMIPIDHDIIGAAGYKITTPDGTVVYTGDYRLHGYYPEVTMDFAKKVSGADVCITEGVTASFTDYDLLHIPNDCKSPVTEYELLSSFEERLKSNKGLLVINPYERNVERVYQLYKTVLKNNKTMVFEPLQAKLLMSFYPEEQYAILQETLEYDEKSYYNELKNSSNVKLILKEELILNPERYVLQLSYEHFYELFDLPVRGSFYLHMDGSPLGDYDPSYAKMLGMLEKLGMIYEHLATGGHCSPSALKQVLEVIAPVIITPLHSFKPENVVIENSKQLLPEKGGVYELSNHELKKVETNQL